MDASRRLFLRGHFSTGTPAAPINNGQAPIRLPWVISEGVFLDGCTRCGDCISACPQHIVVKGDGGFPQLDFTNQECTFCGDCVQSCQQALFDLTEKPWLQVASIGQNCLTFDGIVCQNCKDACEPRAIRFRFGAGGLSRPEINNEACTGCGACIAPCPNGSISMHSQQAQKEANL